MTRVTPTDVREILDTEASDETLGAFIADASRVVDNRVAPHSDDEDALAAVETHLAAHLATSRDPKISSVSHESVSISYNQSDDGSEYWNNAVMIDPTGRLARPNGFPVYSTHQDD